MKFGYVLPNLISPVANRNALVTVAQLADGVGFDSIWATDHILMPVEHPRYAEGTEAITTLAYLAPFAPHLALGLSVLVLPMRNPIIAAKQIASLAHLADREVIVGVGVGWNEIEYGYLNADFHRRGKLLDEYVSIMRTLWTQDNPRHEGTYNFSGATFSPRPKQPIQIWVGGESEAAMERAARIGDGYHPNWDAETNFREVYGRIDELSAKSAGGGRKVTKSVRISFDLRGGVGATVDELLALREQGLEYPAVGFKHETVGDLVGALELFGKEVMPRLRG